MTTSYIVTACTSSSRWFDLDAERGEHKRPPESISLRHGDDEGTERNHNHGRDTFVNSGNPAGAPPLDCWIDDDTATVIRRLINLMCPREVCNICGEPRRRITSVEYVDNNGKAVPDDDQWRTGRGGNVLGLSGGKTPASTVIDTLGWTDCGHDNYRPGVTLDPFANCEETPMSHCSWRHGDVYARLAEIPDASVDLIVTSPPFLALRSYLPADHPDKGKEIGSEATPAAFLSTLLALTREWRRILAPHGSIAVELGDTYAGDDRRNGEVVDVKTPHRQTIGRPQSSRANVGRGWPLAKSLCLIPSLYAGSLAYGRNLLDPDDTIDPWKVRNLIVWHRPNPPVGALGDKVRPSTSYITTACTSDRRWFDLDAERVPAQIQMGRNVAGNNVKGNDDGSFRFAERVDSNPAGAPPLDCWIDGDVWTIPTAPYKGAHYATYPVALPRRLINLMCPREVCVVCGEPRRRITERSEEYAAARNEIGSFNSQANRDINRNSGSRSTLVKAAGRDITCAENITLGWTDCGHGDFRRGVVFDPFAGSGTTGVAASESGRDSILIDIDERNLQLARQRIGLFLDETPPTERATP